jgi:CheY-like chemotaxis protein
MIKRETVILVVDDDEGHAILIVKNLRRAGICNDIKQFRNGQEILDFLMKTDIEDHLQPGLAYILLLDIRMPVVDGVEVLRQLKQDPELAKIHVTMLTTTDDPREIEACYRLGCNNYIAKPVDYDKFVEVIRQLGLFLSVVEVTQA